MNYLVNLILSLVLSLVVLVLGIINTIFLRDQYQQQIDNNKTLSTEENNWFNVTKTSFVCVIIYLVSLFLLGVCIIILHLNNYEGNILKQLCFLFCIIAVTTGLTFSILSFTASAKLIDLYKSDNNKQNIVITSSIHITLVIILIILNIYINFFRPKKHSRSDYRYSFENINRDTSDTSDTKYPILEL
jgi:hypothetical protein